MSIDKAELKALCEAVIHAKDQYLEDELNPQKHQAYLDAEDSLTEVLVPDKVLELIAEAEALPATAILQKLLPEVSDALEELEIHGQHSDQGYRKLKDWYRKVLLACRVIQ